MALSDSRSRWEWWLVLVLRLSAITYAFALLGVFMPLRWMKTVHEEWLGIGKFPGGPVLEYLARTLSLFYVIQGGLMWLVASDVRRFMPVLDYIIWTGIASALAIGAICYRAGMPAAWGLGDGLSLLAMCLILLFLRAKVKGGGEPGEGEKPGAPDAPSTGSGPSGRRIG